MTNPDPTYDSSVPLVPDGTRRLLDDMQRRREGEIAPEALAERYPDLQINGAPAASAPVAATPRQPARANVFDRLAAFTTHDRPKYAKALAIVAITAFVAGGGLMLKSNSHAPVDQSLSQALRQASEGDSYDHVHAIGTSFGAAIRQAASTNNGAYAAGAYAGEQAVYQAWFKALTNPGERLAVLHAQTESALRWHDGRALAQVIDRLDAIPGGDTDSRALLMKAAAAHHFELTANDPEVRSRWHSRAKEADSFAVTNGHTITSDDWTSRTAQAMQQALAEPARNAVGSSSGYRRGFEAAITMAQAAVARNVASNMRISTHAPKRRT